MTLEIIFRQINSSRKKYQHNYVYLHSIWLGLFSTNYCINVALMALIHPPCGGCQ